MLSNFYEFDKDLTMNFRCSMPDLLQQQQKYSKLFAHTLSMAQMEGISGTTLSSMTFYDIKFFRCYHLAFSIIHA